MCNMDPLVHLLSLLAERRQLFQMLLSVRPCHEKGLARKTPKDLIDFDRLVLDFDGYDHV